MIVEEEDKLTSEDIESVIDLLTIRIQAYKEALKEVDEMLENPEASADERASILKMMKSISPEAYEGAREQLEKVHKVDKQKEIDALQNTLTKLYVFKVTLM